MAITFNGTSDIITFATAFGITGPPFTMCCWYLTNNLTQNRGMMSLVNTAGDQDEHWLSLAGDVASDPIQAGSVNQLVSAGAANSVASNGSSTVYHHALGRWVSNSSRQAIADGVGGGIDSVGVTASAPTQLNIGRWSGGGMWWNGSLASIALWNTNLTDTEVAIILAKGFSPRRVRPQNLVCYVDAVRGIRNLVSSTVTPTITGTSETGTHPRLYGL